MNYRIARLVILLVLVGVSAHSSDLGTDNKIPDDARTILEHAQHLELFSIQPELLKDEPTSTFHGWKILGKTKIEEADARQRLVAAFKKGIKENKVPPPSCFNPRHAVRATQDGKTADFVICFECSAVVVYVDGKRVEDFQIMQSPQPVFDRVLTEAKVPLAKKAKNE